MEMYLDEMRAAKWREVDIPPFDAVFDFEKVEERNLDCPLFQISCPDRHLYDIWLCPFP